MLRRIAIAVMAVCSWGALHVQAQKNEFFRPKEVWNDTEGNPINAHGGGVLYYKGTYYWYGEYKVGKTVLPSDATWERYRTDVTGVSCYSSKDLLNWKFEGVVLKANPDDDESDLHPSQVVERPKVIYNKKTKKFVMWIHADSPDYGKAAAGVAVSDSPTGEFKYLGGFRPNDQMSRDQTLFVDDDGTAYQFSSSENNQTMHINRLTADYIRPDGTYVRRFIGMSREAPAVFKYGTKYYMLSSGCTGWDPNSAELAVADSIMGEWTVGDPCTGPDAEKTFYGQSTCVIPIQGKKNAYIACFDMWKKTDLQDSRYIWLPLIINPQTQQMTIPWQTEWNLSIFNNKK
ncbi:MAG: glycoside hydrolase family 43 protein [Paraprevotella sp.]|nr:glycoside hydrolase family 43 protein [Paraprevotella sp.]